MASQEQTGRFGPWRLHSRVLVACGPATKFSPIEQHIAEWLESGANSPPATINAALPYLAGYLNAAAEVGRWWGAVAGAACGVVFGVVAAVVALVIGQ